MVTAAPSRQGSDVRDCRLYRFFGWDPRTHYRTKTLLYVGETVRQPFERMMEHLADQPWFDTVTSWEVDDRVFAGKQQVLQAETTAIRRERPVYNAKENGGNRRRITPPDAIRQRRARDRARGRPRWVHPDDRPGARKPTPPPQSFGRVVAARAAVVLVAVLRAKATRWVAAWATLTGGGWFGLHRYAPLPDWRAEAVVPGVAALGLLVWARRRFRPRRPARRRGRSRRSR